LLVAPALAVALLLLWGGGALPVAAQALPVTVSQGPVQPPSELRVTTFFTDGFALDWQPVSGAMTGGQYRIGIFEGIDGPAVVKAVTANLHADHFVAGGLQPGHTYYVRVSTFVPAQAGQPEDQLSAPAQLIATTLSDQSVLLAIYFAADNDLAPYIPLLRERIRVGSALNPNVRILLLADGDVQNDTTVWEAAGGVITATAAVVDAWGASELDTGDPAVLTWFLQFARSHYQAEQSIVSLMGHGVALAPELAWVPPSEPGEPVQAPRPGIPPLKPQGLDYTPTDVTDGGYLSVTGVGRALAAATDNGAQPFDLLFFDQCFQGSLDVLYEVRQASHVLIASPNYAWLVAPYAQYIPHFAPAATPEQMADDVINIYQRMLNNSNPNAIFWVRGADIGGIAEAVNGLGDALRVATQAGEVWPIEQAALRSKFVDTTQCGAGTLHLGPPDELLGAGSFAGNLQTLVGAGDANGVHAAAGQLLTSLETVTSTFRVGHPYLDRTEFWNYDDTLTIMAPLPRATPPLVAWRASIYRDATPFAAFWTPAPTQTVLVSQTFAFVRDGRWDEFLGDWYTAPRTPTIGAWCSYAPPGLVGAETAVSLTVAATTTSEGLLLTWSPPAGIEPALYQVMVRKPNGVNQVLVAALEANTLSYTLSPGKVGRYEVVVVAVDAAGFVQAIANPVQWDVGDSVQMYLPIVQR